MATVVFHAGAGLPIAVEKGGCHSGSKSGDGYSAAGDVGCSQDRRANADCKYGGRHTGCYFQAATQIHEQTLSFVPKLLLIAVFCMVGGGWMLNTMQDFTRMILQMLG